MAKKSPENPPASGAAKTKPEGVTPSWSHFEPADNDPHDSWDKEAFEATLKKEKENK